MQVELDKYEIKYLQDRLEEWEAKATKIANSHNENMPEGIFISVGARFVLDWLDKKIQKTCKEKDNLFREGVL